MNYTIYNSKRNEVEEKLVSLSKKANKYGCSFSFRFSAPYAKEIDVRKNVYDPGEHCVVTVDAGTITVEAVDVEIDGDELIKKDGWTTLARLEHHETGNLITRFDSASESPESWRHLPAHCEHCRINRARNVTFLLTDASGETRQVGSTCLKDYTGIAPETVVMFAELFDFLVKSECIRENYDEDRERGNAIYNVRTVIAHAIDSIEQNGYRKANASASTALAVAARLARAALPSKDAVAKAEKVVAWLCSVNPSWDLIADCSVLAKEGYCKDAHIGRLAYIPVAYDNEIAKVEEHKAESGSVHVGNVGERITCKIASATLVSSWENAYGTTYLYRFKDCDGNVLVWFASSNQDVNGVSKITGTVKAHDVRDGVNQTVLTRCKVA